MVVPSNEHYDWAKEVKEFDDTKAGVKGLVDAGVAKIPKFFVHPPKSLPAPSKTTLELPTIDFEGVENDGARRKEVVEEIRTAAGKWGFFRIVNHGVPLHIMDAMLEAIKRFHEQPVEDKMHLYSADSRQRVRFNSNVPQREYDSACWRDILTCVFHDDQLDPDAIPLACSEALACLYYPICPEPDKTLGTPKHSDTTFLTLLMQDTIGGLQILHDNQWVDVPPVISNDKFISVEHRVLAQPVGPRISVASFFTPSLRAGAKPFAPIKEILSDENPAIYREFLFKEYYEYYKTKGQDVTSALPHFRINE
ncbi:1-aminocyclopropane-1-carboxylate oxidase-like protein 1 [Forsythia ovata]|uniref:1-aminocyclopropane-1-carboxylate oxidase-like protein 1 n=1 Tax=Forsythia ovata TaxID=205694 RepID=A0ABD1T537_9LAMI